VLLAEFCKCRPAADAAVQRMGREAIRFERPEKLVVRIDGRRWSRLDSLTGPLKNRPSARAKAG